MKRKLLTNTIKKIFFSTPVYDFIISKNLSAKVKHFLNDSWEGDLENGKNFINGYINFYGETLNYKKSIWEKNSATSKWKEALHSFDWIKDLKLVGAGKSGVFVRKEILEWITIYNSWSQLEWRSDILGKRICALLGNLNFFFSSADEKFQQILLKSICKQGNHLIKNNLYDALGFHRIYAVKGIIALSVSLSVFRKYKAAGIKLLIKEINDQVFLDGCHYLKSPSKHIEFLLNLIDIKNYLSTLNIEVPKKINQSIISMSVAAKFFRHPNGSLTTFNNSSHVSLKKINQIIIRSNSKKKVSSYQNIAGFNRIYKNRLYFIMDCGNPVSEDVYAGSLSFELSMGKYQIIVNCGSPYINNKKWAEAMKSSAAHSTANIDNINSSDIIFNNNDKNKRVAKVWSKLKKRDGSYWIDSAHSGYKNYFGLIHSRKIHIDTSKKIVRGQDCFSKSPSEYLKIPKKYSIRFHLHPDLQTNVTRSKKKALIKLPDGSGWEFLCSEPKIEINESIYLGEKQRIIKNNHILIKDSLFPNKKIKWLFRQI